MFNSRKKYYFSDDSVASDTIIASVLGGVSLLAEAGGVAASIYTRGNTPMVFALLYLCALILSVCGIIFAYLGFKAQEGGVKSKRWSVILNVVAIAVPIIFLIV